MKGKVKELFKKWYAHNGLYEVSDFSYLETIEYLHNSFAWGVMQDFYDSQKIEIKVLVNHNNGKYVSDVSASWEVRKEYKTRQKARLQYYFIERAKKVVVRSYLYKFEAITARDSMAKKHNVPLKYFPMKIKMPDDYI